MKCKLIENDLKNILKSGGNDTLWKAAKNFLYEANKYNRLSSIKEVIFRYKEDDPSVYKKNYLWSTDDNIMHLAVGDKIAIISPLMSVYINKSSDPEEKIDRLFSYLFLGNILIKKWNMDENELPYMLRAAKKNHRNTIFDCIIDLEDDSRKKSLVDQDIYLKMVDKETRDKIIINHIL